MAACRQKNKRPPGAALYHGNETTDELQSQASCTHDSCAAGVFARRERLNWGPASLMRPAKAAPELPFVTLPLHWSPNVCASDHRGISDPVVPFKSSVPHLRKTPTWRSCCLSASLNFQVTLRAAGSSSDTASRPGRLPRPVANLSPSPAQPILPRRPTPRTAVIRKAA